MILRFIPTMAENMSRTFLNLAAAPLIREKFIGCDFFNEKECLGAQKQWRARLPIFKTTLDIVHHCETLDILPDGMLFASPNAAMEFLSVTQTENVVSGLFFFLQGCVLGLLVTYSISRPEIQNWLFHDCAGRGRNIQEALQIGKQIEGMLML